MTTQELYLKTIFCCMACDGDIANEEVAMVREMTSGTDLFGELPDFINTTPKPNFCTKSPFQIILR